MRARPNPINNLQESRRKVQTILGAKSHVWRFSQHHKQSGGPGRRAAGVHNSGYIEYGDAVNPKAEQRAIQHHLKALRRLGYSIPEPVVV